MSIVRLRLGVAVLAALAVTFTAVAMAGGRLAARRRRRGEHHPHAGAAIHGRS